MLTSLLQSFGTPMRGSLSSSEKDTLITELQAKVTRVAPGKSHMLHLKSHVNQVSSLYAELRVAEEATADMVTLHVAHHHARTSSHLFLIVLLTMQDGKIDMMKRDAQLYRETTQVCCTSHLTHHASLLS